MDTGDGKLGLENPGSSSGQQLLIVDGGICGMSEEEELALATAIFELGLKYSSPKVLLGLMPESAGLNTEHLKSHL